MFRIAKERSVWWPVDVREPIDGGDYETRRFTARLRLLDLDRLAELKPDEMLLEVLLDWTDVGDETGVALTYSEATRDRLIADPHVRAALLRAYAETVAGAKAKN
jgi:hypothetical protein